MMTDATQGPDGFAVYEVKCPSCNGAIHIPENSDTATCAFCGSVVHVSFNRGRSGIDPDGTIRDTATGRGLFRVRVPGGWQVTSTALQNTGSISRPYVPQAELRNRSGGIIAMRAGDAGTRQSAGLSALTAMYGGHLAGIDTVNYADMPNPVFVADAEANSIAARMGATPPRVLRQLGAPNLEAKQQKEYARFQRVARAEGGIVSQPFIAVVLRTYELSVNGQPFKLASYIELGAVKDGSGVGEGIGAGLAGGLGGLMDGISSLFGGGNTHQSAQGAQQGGGIGDFLRGGGLIGQMRRNQQVQQAQQAAPWGQQQQQPQQQWGQQPQQQQQPQSQSASWCMPDFDSYTHGGTIYWSISTVVTYLAPADSFDATFERVFLPLVATLDVHPDVESMAIQASQNYSAQVQQATQSQLARNQAAFQAQQAAHRQQQAAFDSYNQSISDARDAHHRQFMDSSRSQFDHAAPDYSEAIRGVNTYTTSDGREVEVSVRADRAYENQAGDVIGVEGSFDPGASWTEIPRT